MLNNPELLGKKDLDMFIEKHNRERIANHLYDTYKNNKIYKKLSLYGAFLIKCDEPFIDSQHYKCEYNDIVKLNIKSNDLNEIHNYVMRNLHPKTMMYFDTNNIILSKI
jgi:hypothetical protein